MKRILIGVALLMFAASLILAWVGLRGGPVQSLTRPPGDPAVAVQSLLAATLPDNEGKPQALAQWRGRLLVINYWATWCPPCRDEMPALSRLQQRYSTRGVQFIGIAIDDAAKVREFARSYPVSYPILVADQANAEISRALGNQSMSLPFTVVIDGNGGVRSAVLGRIREQSLTNLLDEIL